MSGYFFLRSSDSDQWVFTLRSMNHETLLTGHAFKSKAAALTAIDAIRRSAAGNANYERRTSSSGMPYFVLKSNVGSQTLGRGETYTSAGAMEAGLSPFKPRHRKQRSASISLSVTRSAAPHLFPLKCRCHGRLDS